MTGLSLILGVLIWLPLVGWVWSLVGWMITGEIDPLTGIIGVCVGFFLGVTAMVPPVPILSPIAFTIVIGTMVMYPFIYQTMTKRESRALDVDGLERAYNALRLRPDNPTAHYRVATHLWPLGMSGQAVAIAEKSLSQMPADSFREEHRILVSWKRRVETQPAPQPLECLDCGQLNEPSEVFCSRCRAPFLLTRARRRMMPGHTGRRLIGAWAALVAILAGIPAATALPPTLTAVTVVALLAAAGTVAWVAFRPGVGAET